MKKLLLCTKSLYKPKEFHSFLMDYFGSTDFGPFPFHQLLKVSWKIFTLKGSVLSMLILTMLMCSLVYTILKFHLIKSLTWLKFPYIVPFIIWLCCQASSLICIGLYARIMCLNYSTLRLIYSITRTSYMPYVAVLVLIIVESLCAVFVYFEMVYWYKDISTVVSRLEKYSSIYWYFMGTRLLQHILQGIFFITVCPLQRTWTSYAGLNIKLHTIQVIPWTYYNLVHSILFILTLRNLDHNYAQFHTLFIVFYPVIFIYTCFKLFWLTFLGVQLTNLSIVPVLYPPEADIHRFEEGVFEDMTNWTRDSKSEVVPGVELKFFRSFLPDKSQIVCGTPGDRFMDVMKPLEDNEILRKKLLEEPELINTPLIKSEDEDDFIEESPRLTYDPNELLNLQDDDDIADDGTDYPNVNLYSEMFSAASALSDTDELIAIGNTSYDRRSGSSTMVEYQDGATLRQRVHDRV